MNRNIKIFLIVFSSPIIVYGLIIIMKCISSFLNLYAIGSEDAWINYFGVIFGMLLSVYLLKVTISNENKNFLRSLEAQNMSYMSATKITKLKVPVNLLSTSPFNLGFDLHIENVGNSPIRNISVMKNQVHILPCELEIKSIDLSNNYLQPSSSLNIGVSFNYVEDIDSPKHIVDYEIDFELKLQYDNIISNKTYVHLIKVNSVFYERNDEILILTEDEGYLIKNVFLG